MATFFMFGKYVGEAAEKISAARTEQARQVVGELLHGDGAVGNRALAEAAEIGRNDAVP